MFDHTDTLGRTVYAYDVDPSAGLANKRIFVRFAKEDGHPDGTVVDAEGGFWIGSFGGGVLRRFSSAAALVAKIKFPSANVTKAAFGGENLRTVYVTTALVGLDSRTLRAQTLAGGLFSLTADVSGQPQLEVRL